MSTDPELKGPVSTFASKLDAGDRNVPLADLAAIFGADEELQSRVRTRGDIVFRDSGTFSNDGPEMVLPAGRIELEIPSLIRGEWTSEGGGFSLRFGMAEFSIRACARIAILRKCFDLRELRATSDDLVLDFGSDLADRRYTF